MDPAYGEKIGVYKGYDIYSFNESRNIFLYSKLLKRKAPIYSFVSTADFVAFKNVGDAKRCVDLMEEDCCYEEKFMEKAWWWRKENKSYYMFPPYYFLGLWRVKCLIN